MAKRILILIFAFSMLFTATVAADSLWGNYEGFSKAKVRVNNADLKFSENDVPAFVVNGRTVLPVRQLTDALQALVKWDKTNQTADIYKPNVHMFFAEDVGAKDYSIKKPFGRVPQGKMLNFVVFAQVDSLKTPVQGFRISIEDPNGKPATDSLVVPFDKTDSSFWYPWPFTVNFTEKGDYKVKFAFLSNDEYTVVSEKVITSE
jgi:hypothetical protein